MKEIITPALLLWAGLATSAQAQNQLAGTAWQGSVRLYRFMDVVLQFGKDTVRMYSVPDDILRETKLLETMTYTTKDSTFTWKKVGGGSPCDSQTPGTYQVAIKNDEMTLTLIKDDCEGRSTSLLPAPFKKVAFAVK